MSLIWGDPSEGLVGVYLSIASGILSSKRADVNFDLFANAVYAAIDD